MSTNKNTPEKIEEDALLKAMKDVENDILMKAMQDDQTDESSTTTEDESATDEKKKGLAKSEKGASEPVANKGAQQEQAATQEEADGNGSELNPGGERLKGEGGKIAKSFSDTKTPEAEKAIDGVPFLVALAESQDSVAAVVNDLQKSFGAADLKTNALAKGLLALGRELVNQREVNAELVKSLNEIKGAIKLPVRAAPKSVLSKSEIAERFDGDTKAPAEQPAKRQLSKAQISGILTDAVIKGELEAIDAIQYESTTEVTPNAAAIIKKALATRAA